MSVEGTLRDSLNTSDLNRVADDARQLAMGDLLALVIAGLTATETSITVTANVATLAAQPSSMFQVNATAGTSTGVKKLRRGPITGTGAIVPNPGECVWNGALSVLFNAADAVTTASFTYAKADGSQKASALFAVPGAPNLVG